MNWSIQKRVEASPRGYTLVELLVAIGVITLIICLIIPAVQSAREAARRGQCANNLHQIGIAISSYETVHNALPSSPLANARGLGVTAISEITFLLPHMDQALLYNSLNMEFGTDDSGNLPSKENHTARNTRISNLLCPSDGETNHLNSYRFNGGKFGNHSGPAFDGPFSIRRILRPVDIVDGLSQTAFVSERIGGSYSARGSAPRDIKTWVNFPGIIRSDEAFIPLCVNSHSTTWMNTSGRYWLYTGFADTHYNHNGSPNDPRPSCGPSLEREQDVGLHPPRSFHYGNVNVLMGDAHVKSILDSIQPQIWSALGTHNSDDM